MRAFLVQVAPPPSVAPLNTWPTGVCNFLDASKWFDPGARIVYRQYATLFFIFAIDASESELGILDLIQARASGPPPHPPCASQLLNTHNGGAGVGRPSLSRPAPTRRRAVRSQVLVEALDRNFKNVCELDIIFNFHKAYYILDELFIGGELQESSKKEVLKVCAMQDDLMDENKDGPQQGGGRRNSGHGR